MTEHDGVMTDQNGLGRTSEVRAGQSRSEQTATERLRALLDERGVEWEAPKSAMSDMRTIYSVDDWDVQVDESGNGWFDIDMTRYAATPEQAVAATLGPGTCHIDLVDYNEREDRFQCRSCDWSIRLKRGTWPRFNYCPGCGRKVVE